MNQKVTPPQVPTEVSSKPGSRFAAAVLKLTASAASGVVASFLFHISQARWLATRCVPVPTVSSCDSPFTRLWLLPVCAGALVTLAIAAILWTMGSRARAKILMSDLKKALTFETRRPAISYAVSFGAALVIVMSVFQLRYGWEIILPSNTAWLAQGDMAQSYLGSALYRSAPWGFPLGRLDSVMAPMGTNAAHADPIFLAALFAKLIRGIFDSHDQFQGLWVLVCYVSFAAGCALVSMRTARALASRVVVSLFLVFFPPLFYRIGHLTLNALWILPFGTFALLTEFNDQERGIGRRWPLLLQSGLVAVAAWLHPYLCLTALVFFAVHAYFIFARMPSRRGSTAVQAGAIGGWVFVSWYVIGYIGSGIPTSDAAKPVFWTANLNALFNPIDSSFFLRPQALATGGQYEGYGYLGAGALLLLVALVARRGFTSIGSLWKTQKPLFSVALVGLVLSQGCLVTFYGLKLELPGWGYGALLSPFRSVGRLVWIPSFIALVCLCWVLFRRERAFSRQPEPAFHGPRRLSPLAGLAAAFVLQVIDLQSLFTRFQWPHGDFSERLGSSDVRETWLQLASESSRILGYPAGGSTVARDDDYALFWWLTLKTNVPTNVGYLARFDATRVAAENESLRAILSSGSLKARTLYVIPLSRRDEFPALTMNECRALDIYFVCRARL